MKRLECTGRHAQPILAIYRSAQKKASYAPSPGWPLTSYKCVKRAVEVAGPYTVSYGYGWIVVEVPVVPCRYILPLTLFGPNCAPQEVTVPYISIYLPAEKLAPEAIWPEKVWKLLNVGLVPVATARADAYAETGVSADAMPILAANPNEQRKLRRERCLSTIVSFHSRATMFLTPRSKNQAPFPGASALLQFARTESSRCRSLERRRRR